MRSGARFPDDAAEVGFSDVLVEQLEDLNDTDKIAVVAQIHALCAAPAGKHPLSARESRALVGWNTVEVLGATHRVVFKAQLVDGVGTILALCLGPRRGSEVYTIAAALVQSGLLSRDEVTDLWLALGILDVQAEQVGLDGWDYRPDPAPQGMRRAVVSAGLLDEDTAALLSADEVQAAMEGGWTSSGPDPDAALAAAMRRARGGVGFDSAARIVFARADDRCGQILPRAQVPCVRRLGHPGAHRSA